MTEPTTPGESQTVYVRALTDCRHNGDYHRTGDVFLADRAWAKHMATKYSPVVAYVAAGAVEAAVGTADASRLHARVASLSDELAAAHARIVALTERADVAEARASTLTAERNAERSRADSLATSAAATPVDSDAPDRIEYAERIARLLAGPAAERDAAAGALGISGKMNAAERADAMLVYAPERLAELRHIGAGGAVS